MLPRELGLGLLTSLLPAAQFHWLQILHLQEIDWFQGLDSHASISWSSSLNLNKLLMTAPILMDMSIDLTRDVCLPAQILVQPFTLSPLIHLPSCMDPGLPNRLFRVMCQHNGSR